MGLTPKNALKTLFCSSKLYGKTHFKGDKGYFETPHNPHNQIPLTSRKRF
ncbi:hypothetical protein HMPREF1394_00541 [Helicobacter pylori GAM105Ai]|nr:hypothetical protein HMPREF1394_00541 [Helicobacter pylori GAM105Ai]